MSDEETKQELIVLGMRTKAGVNFARFKQLTKQDLMQVSIPLFFCLFLPIHIFTLILIRLTYSKPLIL